MLVIEQVNIATTPRYNFPQSLEDLGLPQRFIELSLRSMRNVEGAYFQSYEVSPQESMLGASEEITPFFPHNQLPTVQSIPLKPLYSETKIAAIDVSSVRVGETATGMLFAVRGSVVWKEKSQYRFLRLGPFPFHITEENKREIYNLFRQYYFGTLDEVSAPSLIFMQTRMGNLLERWIQMAVCSASRDSIILWDGSLTAGMVDSPLSVVSQLLDVARRRSNTVLAFSKTTRLRLFGSRLTDLMERCQPPCLLEIDGHPVSLSGPVHFLGNIYVAKLAEGSCSFRLDIDRKVSREGGVEAVQRLLGNDLLPQSYPETLRLAHIFATFTANEVIGIQRFIAQKCGLRIVARPNIRRILFGPYGKGPEG